MLHKLGGGRVSHSITGIASNFSPNPRKISSKKISKQRHQWFKYTGKMTVSIFWMRFFLFALDFWYYASPRNSSVCTQHKHSARTRAHANLLGFCWLRPPRWDPECQAVPVEVPGTFLHKQKNYPEIHLDSQRTLSSKKGTKLKDLHLLIFELTTNP